MRNRTQNVRVALGTLLLLAIIIGLFPSGTVQAEKVSEVQPISVVQQIADPIPQWPTDEKTKVTCVIEFSPEVNAPGANKGDGSGHEGLDICAAGGTAVYPILPGEIVHIGSWASWLGSPWGDSVIIKSTYQGKVVFLIYTHLDSTRFNEIGLNKWIKQGEPLGYMSPIKGNSVAWSTPHVHVGLFNPQNDPVSIEQKLTSPKPNRDPYKQAEVLSDWMLIWDNPRNILGQNAPKASPVESAPPSTWPTGPVALSPTWVEKIPTSGEDWEKVIWGAYTEVYLYVTGQRVVQVTPVRPTVVTPVPTQPASVQEATIGTPVEISISAQSRDLTYQENIRRFYAGVTANKDVEALYQMDTQSFTGSWVIPMDQTLSLNDEFGWADYEEGQGMGIPAGMKIGDGNCNAASAARAALLRAGIEAIADKPTHPPVPGVDSSELATVCISTPAYPCGQDLDVKVTNRLGFPVRLNWKVEGDQLTLWVTKIDVLAPAPTAPDVQEVLPTMTPDQELPLWWILLGVMVLSLIIIIWLRPGWIGSAMIWTVRTGPMWLLTLSEAVKSASRWWLIIMTLTVVLTPELAHVAIYGFGDWVKGETTISNMTIVVVVLFFLANLLLNRWFYVKETRDMGGYWIVTKKKHGCFGQLLHFVIAIVLVAALFFSLGAAAVRPSPQPNPNPTIVTDGACNGKLFAELVKGTAYESSMPPADRQAAISSLVSKITPELEAIYFEAEQRTGIPCEVIAGIHMVEATSRFNSGTAINYSVISGREIGTPEPDRGGQIYSSLLESAIDGAEILRDDKADGSIDSVEELIGALSLYNGGGNRNCRDYWAKIPYGGCPRLFVGEDDPYAMSWFDAKHDKMFLLYCADNTACAPQDFRRAGSFTLAYWFYSQVTSQR